jgi:hypothetical protein
MSSELAAQRLAVCSEALLIVGGASGLVVDFESGSGGRIGRKGAAVSRHVQLRCVGRITRKPAERKECREAHLLGGDRGPQD